MLHLDKHSRLVEEFLPHGMGERRRLNDSLLQPLELPLLRLLVRGVPRWAKPDHLTWFGLFGAAVAFAAYALSRGNELFLFVASLGLVMNWYGDSLDGTLARFRRTPRHRYGLFMDQTMDLFAQLLIGFGLALSGHLRAETACVALLSYIAITAYQLIRERATGVLQITFLRCGPTELRCLMIGLNTYLFLTPPGAAVPIWGAFALPRLDIGIIAVSLATLVALAIAAIREGRRLSSEDP